MSLNQIPRTIHARNSSLFDLAFFGAPFKARRAKCPPATGRAINGPSAKLRSCYIMSPFHIDIRTLQFVYCINR